MGKKAFCLLLPQTHNTNEPHVDNGFLPQAGLEQFGRFRG